DPIGHVKMGGDLVGSGPSSARIESGGTLKSLIVRGNVIGGFGQFSCRIASRDDMGPVKIGGDLRGGAAEQSGWIAVVGNGNFIASVTLGGSLIGGSGQQSGVIEAHTRGIGTVKI